MPHRHREATKEHHRVYQTEHGGVGADASHGYDGDKSKGGDFQENAKGVAQDPRALLDLGAVQPDARQAALFAGRCRRQPMATETPTPETRTRPAQETAG